MKKILFIALALLVATPMAAQKKAKKGKNAQPATTVPMPEPPALKPVPADLLSYALGVMQSPDFAMFLERTRHIPADEVGKVMEGMKQFASAPKEAQREMYLQATGVEIAANIHQEEAQYNTSFAGKADTTYVLPAEIVRGLEEAGVLHNATLAVDSARALVDQQYQYQMQSRLYAGRLFLYNNSLRKGVKVLPSGLQYEVRTQGTGPVANDSTEVEVHYEGRLLDGTVFDSSYKRGAPATFRPTQVIAGWKEALTLMPEGSVWELYIPSELAYGERGAGQSIPGNSTLVFTVEVIKVKQ